MAVVSKEELIQALSTLIGETPDDTGLSIIENLTDTISDYESKTVDTSEWESKYNELDNSWRKRYKERFLGSADADHETSGEEVKEKQKEDVEKDSTELTFDDLFEKSEP